LKEEEEKEQKGEGRTAAAKESMVNSYYHSLSITPQVPERKKRSFQMGGRGRR